MAKPTQRTYSRQNAEALDLLSQMIRAGRIDRKITTREMAERAGISRALLQRIEKGDPTCAIGSVFEVAVIAGVSLFDKAPDQLQTLRSTLAEKLSLIPQYARKPRRVIHDNF
jgi:transcriptional regulator with XRE-family HTH domain